MRSLFPLSLAAAAVLLTACHSHGGYLSSDPELVYGPGVVEFPEPTRVYLPLYRRAAAASSIGVQTAGAQLAHAQRLSQPVPPAVHHVPPARAPHALPPGHPPVGAAPARALPLGHPPAAPPPGTHRVMVYEHPGPAPLPPPGAAVVDVRSGQVLRHPGGAQRGVHPR